MQLPCDPRALLLDDPLRLDGTTRITTTDLTIVGEASNAADVRLDR